MTTYRPHTSGNYMDRRHFLKTASVAAAGIAVFGCGSPTPRTEMVLASAWLVVAYFVGRSYAELVRSGQPPQPRRKQTPHPFEKAA